MRVSDLSSHKYIQSKIVRKLWMILIYKTQVWCKYVHVSFRVLLFRILKVNVFGNVSNRCLNLLQNLPMNLQWLQNWKILFWQMEGRFMYSVVNPIKSDQMLSVSFPLYTLFTANISLPFIRCTNTFTNVLSFLWPNYNEKTGMFNYFFSQRSHI